MPRRCRAMGGRRVADRKEPLRGTPIERKGSGRPDLDAALACQELLFTAR